MIRRRLSIIFSKRVCEDMYGNSYLISISSDVTYFTKPNYVGPSFSNTHMPKSQSCSNADHHQNKIPNNSFKSFEILIQVALYMRTSKSIDAFRDRLIGRDEKRNDKKR